MASEYLLKKYQDVKPDEVREMTKEEKRRNWWHYHKWHVVFGIAGFAFLLSILLSVLGVGKVEPDYSIAYVGSWQLSSETIQALCQEFAARSTDINGDGKVIVNVNQYITPNSDDSNSIYLAQAAQAQLIGDLSLGTSYFFLLEDPELFQSQTFALCGPDGSLPPDDDPEAAGKYLMWTDCPVLKQMDVPSQLVPTLAFARRGFRRNNVAANAAECAALWDIFTEGATLP